MQRERQAIAEAFENMSVIESANELIEIAREIEVRRSVSLVCEHALMNIFRVCLPTALSHARVHSLFCVFLAHTSASFLSRSGIVFCAVLTGGTVLACAVCGWHGTARLSADDSVTAIVAAKPVGLTAAVRGSVAAGVGVGGGPADVNASPC